MFFKFYATYFSIHTFIQVMLQPFCSLPVQSCIFTSAIRLPLAVCTVVYVACTLPERGHRAGYESSRCSAARRRRRRSLLCVVVRNCWTARRTSGCVTSACAASATTTSLTSSWKPSSGGQSRASQHAHCFAL